MATILSRRKWVKLIPSIHRCIIHRYLFQSLFHDDVIKWRHFPRYWPFVRGIHRFPVTSPHKGQWRGALMFSLICVWINDWISNREAGDLGRYRAHYGVTVMPCYRYPFQTLFHSGEGKIGRDAEVFIDILTGRSYAHLNAVFNEYERATEEGHSMEEAIESQFSGDIKMGLLTLGKWTMISPDSKVHGAYMGPTW